MTSLSPVMKRFKCVALYCRVSKDDQSVDQQMSSISEWIGERADKIVVFAEKRSSRKERPVKEAMMVRVRAGEFDAVAVWKTDRFARGSVELLSWRDESIKLGYAILSLTDAVDTSTPEGRFHFGIMACVAELERDLTQQRTKATLAHMRREGLPTGGKPRAKYDEALAARLAPRSTVRALARSLGVSKTTAARIKKSLEKPPKQGDAS